MAEIQNRKGRSNSISSTNPPSSSNRATSSRDSPIPEHNEPPPSSPLSREPITADTRGRYNSGGNRQQDGSGTSSNESPRPSGGRYPQPAVQTQFRSRAPSPSESGTGTEEIDTDSDDDGDREYYPDNSNKMRRTKTEPVHEIWIPPEQTLASKNPTMHRRASINSTNSGPSRPPSVPVRTPSTGIRSEYLDRRESPSLNRRGSHQSPEGTFVFILASSKHVELANRFTSCISCLSQARKSILCIVNAATVASETRGCATIQQR